MADIEDRLVTWLRLLSTELDARMPLTQKLDRYAAGYPDVPEHVREIKAEAEYRVLLRQAVTNWPELIVESSAERMEVVGFDFGAKDLNEKAWTIWEQAELDADSNDLHEAMLTNGRAYALVWPTADGGVTVTLEHASTTIVAYNTRTGEPEAAMRRWEDDGNWYATLYLPDGVYKFVSKDGSRPNPDGKTWVRRDVPGESWPLVNWAAPDIPVVEFQANSSLSGLASSADQCAIGPRKVSRIFGGAHGDFERVIPIIDRINTTIFAGLLGQAFASFPVRALIGDPMNYRPVLDENGEPVLDPLTGEPLQEPTEPFKAAVNRLVQIENPDGKLVQLDPQDLGNYTKFAQSHVSHLAAITKTPSYYFGDLVNISADTIRASEAGHIKKVKKHSRRAGKSWARVQRLAMIASGNGGSDLLLPRVRWSNPETRSMAEAADAARKLVGVIPWTAIAERFLNATPEEIRQWQADMAVEALNTQPVLPDMPAAPDMVPA